MVQFSKFVFYKNLRMIFKQYGYDYAANDSMNRKLQIMMAMFII